MLAAVRAVQQRLRDCCYGRRRSARKDGTEYHVGYRDALSCWTRPAMRLLDRTSFQQRQAPPWAPFWSLCRATVRNARKSRRPHLVPPLSIRLGELSARRRCPLVSASFRLALSSARLGEFQFAAVVRPSRRVLMSPSLPLRFREISARRCRLSVSASFLLAAVVRPSRRASSSPSLSVGFGDLSARR